jgi:MYXO-CTERM domain-containing protein
MRKLTALAAAATLAALAPAAASAQGTGTTGTGTVDTSYGDPQEDDDGFPWGLLGLLGLAGLLPRKRHERVDVDNRTRP